MAKRLSEKQIAKALMSTGGVIKDAADELERDRSTIYKRIRQSEKLQLAQTEAREILLDMAESKLFDEVEAGNMKAICYVLSRLGRHRGYSLRHEISGTVGMDHHGVRIYLPDNGRDDSHEIGAGVVIVGDTPEKSP